MRVRHRIPSIFNLSMVDVLCCALGCVILLWLINLREADEHQREQSALLENTTSERNAESARVHDLELERATIKKELRGFVVKARDLEERLQLAQARAMALEKDLHASDQRATQQRTRTDQLTKKLTAAD